MALYEVSVRVEMIEAFMVEAENEEDAKHQACCRASGHYNEVLNVRPEENGVVEIPIEEPQLRKTYAVIAKEQGLMAKAIEIDDLDAALRAIMDPLGITDGGTAGMYFCRVYDNDLDEYENWRRASASERLAELEEWLRLEEIHRRAHA